MTSPCWGFHKGICLGVRIVHFFDENGKSLCHRPRKGGHYTLYVRLPRFNPATTQEIVCPKCREYYVPGNEEAIEQEA